MTDNDKTLTLAAARALPRHRAEHARLKAELAKAPRPAPERDETPEGKAQLAAYMDLRSKLGAAGRHCDDAQRARETVRRELVSPELDRAQTAAHNAVLAAKDALRKAREKLRMAEASGDAALVARHQERVASHEADLSGARDLLLSATARVDAEVAELCGDAPVAAGGAA